MVHSVVLLYGEDRKTALTRIGAVKQAAGGDPAQVQTLQNQTHSQEV